MKCWQVWIWQMTLENNRAPLLYYIKLCASFQIHRWSQTWVTVRKRSIRVKIGDFLSCVTSKFDGWAWKTIGHLFYTTSSLVHHFKAMGEFKLELQSGNAQFGSKSAIFFPCDLEIWRMTLNKANLRNLIAATDLVILLKMDSFVDFSARVTSKFDGWPKKIIGHLFYTTSSFVHHFKAISELSFVHHFKAIVELKLELQSRHAQFRPKSGIFLSCVTLKFDGWPSKTIGYLFYVASSFVHHFIAISEFKLKLQSGNAWFG